MMLKKIFDLFNSKKSAGETAGDPDTLQAFTPDPAALFVIEMITDGEQYNAARDPKTPRRELIRKFKPGAPSEIQADARQGKPVLYVLDDNGIDAANIPQPFTNYLFDTVDGLKLTGIVKQTDPLKLYLTVYGKLKHQYEWYNGEQGKHGKEYTYNLNNESGYYHLPAGAEIMCDLQKTDTGFKVFAGPEEMGAISDERVERLDRMLKRYSCITTAIEYPHAYTCGIKMILRF